ncbi:MAG: PDZ domain-containing protein [bacterium]
MLKLYKSHRITKSFTFVFLFGGLLLIALNAGNAVEKTQKGWLGVRVQEMTPSQREAYKLGNRSGLLITDVVDDSPADDAGLWEEDVIVEFDGQQVEKADDFARMVRKTEPSTKVKLLIIRDGEEKKVEVTLSKRRIKRRRPVYWNDNNILIIGGRPRLGVRVQELNEDLAPYFKVEKNSGVLIWEVSEDSPAEKAGLKAGDVITKIDDEQISNPEDLIEALDDYEEGDVITVEYVCKSKVEKVEIELEDSDFFDLRIGRPGRPRIRIHRFGLDIPHAPEIIMHNLRRDFDAI